MLLSRGALLTTVTSTPLLKVTELIYREEPGMPWVITQLNTGSSAFALKA